MLLIAVSYKRLWKLLVDKEMSKSDLRKKAEIVPNTMTKLRRDEEVSLTILSKICKTLNADFGDIVEYVPDAEIVPLVVFENVSISEYEHLLCSHTADGLSVNCMSIDDFQLMFKN